MFNFCAIPQSMAIATLELCFRNPAVFQRNIKITKGEACQLMMDSTQNLYLVYQTFRRYARKIHKKNTPKDPNFLKISLVCGRVSDNDFPLFLDYHFNVHMQIEKFVESIFPSQSAEEAQRRLTGAANPAEEQKAREDAEAKKDMYFIMGLMGVVVLIVAIVMVSPLPTMVGRDATDLF